jgi:hypothetical protein
MKSRRVNAWSVIATVLLGFSIVFGASRASAEDLDAISCLSPTVIAENPADVSEALEVACLALKADASASAIEGQAIPVEDTQSVLVPDPANDIRLWFADGSFLSAIEGRAIPTEVAQSMTIATLGHDVAEQEADITDSAPSVAMASAPAVASRRSVVILDPEE